jgi:hypothetical protein
LISKRHKNIDDIIKEAGAIIKSQFIFWQKIANIEKHPPEWQNTDRQPFELESSPDETWSTLSIDDWNLLARKLNISNPSLTETRKGSKETDRKKELLEHFTNIAIQIPKSIFIDGDKITAGYKQTSGDSATHVSFAKQVRENELSKGLNNIFYEIKPDSDLPKVLAKEKQGYSAGAVVKEILYTKTTDTLLWGICLAYQKKLLATGKLSDTANIDSASISVTSIGQQNFNWIIGGKTIAIKQKQLKKMIFDFKLKEMETIISRGLNKEDTAEAIEKVFSDNYVKSLHFIQRAFELEEAVLGDCAGNRYENTHIEFNEVLAEIGEDYLSEEKKLILRELRNAAFHTTIPKVYSYEEGIEIIEEFLTKKGFEFREFIRPELEYSKDAS